MPPSYPVVPAYKIAILVFLQAPDDRHLLLRRIRPPNRDSWSPLGGKLETSLGESPFECAVRETYEEAELRIRKDDLHLFAMVAEKSYEDSSHWLLFLFTCSKRIPAAPPSIDEGSFALFPRAEIDALALPDTDRTILWPLYDRHRNDFVALKADCSSQGALHVEIEQITASPTTAQD